MLSAGVAEKTQSTQELLVATFLLQDEIFCKWLREGPSDGEKVPEPNIPKFGPVSDLSISRYMS